MHEIRRVHEMFRRAHDTISHVHEHWPLHRQNPRVITLRSYISPSSEPTVDYASFLYISIIGTHG